MDWTEPRLEADVQTMSDAEAARWGRWGLLTLAVTIALIGVLFGLSRFISLTAAEAAWVTLGAEALVGVVTLKAAGAAAGSLPAFMRAVGLTGFRWWDVRGWLLGILWQYLAAIPFTIIVTIVARHAGSQSSNLRGFHRASDTDLVLIAVAAVLIAPAVEEVQFRALLLRGAMHRWGFMPAALSTSFLFGALHGYEVHHLGGAVVLIFRLAIFAFVQCLLVRRYNRLGPNIAVHATFNLVAILVAATR